MDLRFILASAVEIAGIVVLGVGLWMLAPWLGVAVSGLGMIALGFALDLPKRGDR